MLLYSVLYIIEWALYFIGSTLMDETDIGAQNQLWIDSNQTLFNPLTNYFKFY